jgi:thymidylate synthase ThyX
LTLQSGAPRVTLRNAPSLAYDGAIAAARTCYAPRVIGAHEITEKQRETIGKLTFEAGHHTVYQHATFEFGLENVSRQFVWSALHSYPFYNSEQQSQRYVKLGEPRAFVPAELQGEALAVYEDAVVAAWRSYGRLSTLLKDDTFRILKELRHVTPRASADRLKALEREAEKKAIETARYVVPVAAFTAMVHTISGITLYRLLRMARASDTPHEARQVVEAMVAAVRLQDPAFIDRLDVIGLEADEVVESGFPAPRAGGDAFAERFDRSMNGRVAVLVDAPANAEEVIAEAIRAVFGCDEADLPTDEAIDRVLDPARNPYRLDTINVAYHSPLMRTLQHASYTFRKRLSHTADSQDQRHRMVPGSRPLLAFTDTVRPDYVTPRMIRANPAALEEYDAAMRRAWDAKNRLLALGVPLEFALYLLPNAKVIRFLESGPLIALLHKWTMRTCFNAQEEIYDASMEEVAELRSRHPRLARFIGPPCVVRNGLVSPRCTEGTKFCGVPVWRDFPNAVRRL